MDTGKKLNAMIFLRTIRRVLIKIQFYITTEQEFLHQVNYRNGY